MPAMDWFSTAVLKRKAPIKAVLLDQNGPLCGLGNWLVSCLTFTQGWTYWLLLTIVGHGKKVDEILFQATIHPAQRASTLSTAQMEALYKQITEVVNTAVAVNADHKLFPKHWLFKYRWGKGRRNEPATFTLPDGSLATVIHQTVGGRTTAIVETVQKLLGEVASDDEGLAASEEADEEEEKVKEKIPKAPKASRTKKRGKMIAPAQSEEEQPKTISSPRKGSRRSVKKEEIGKLLENDMPADVKAEETIVRVTTRKRAIPARGAAKVKVEEVVVDMQPASSRARRASARQTR